MSEGPGKGSYPRIIAHRCGGALAPENTLAGLKIAAALGCTGIEFDVMLSADSAPVIIHDETLERTTNGHGRVPEHSLHALQQLDAGGKHHKAYAGETIPQLEALMASAARHRLWTNIEIKPATGHDDATGKTVAQALAAWRGPGIVSSFSGTALRSARAVAPSLPLALLYERLPANWRDERNELGALAIHLAARHVSEATAEALGDVPWACYTVNDASEADRLFALGCTAIFTDRPDLW